MSGVRVPAPLLTNPPFIHRVLRRFRGRRNRARNRQQYPKQYLPGRSAPSSWALYRSSGSSLASRGPAFDIVVTTDGLFHSSNGEPVPKESEVPSTQLVVTGRRLPNTGLPGLIAGQKLLAGSDDTLPGGLRASIGKTGRRSDDVGPPRLHGHAGEHPFDDDALPQQFGLD